MRHAWSRRSFLTSLGAAPLAGSVGRRGAAIPATEGAYARLGVRPLINAAGTYTALSASLLPDEVVAAMEEAARQHVSIHELHAAAGRRIAELVRAEAALVTSGCAAAITLGTAACVAGSDGEKIRRLPDTRGMKSEVLLPKGHRFVYDHAVRAAGVRIVEAANAEELERRVGEQTAMLFYLNHETPGSPITREAFVAVGRKTGVPTMVDAAADLPPAENLHAFQEMGFDLVTFSGGKGLRGPQCSGLLLGRKDLVEAAYLNGSPHADTVGRGLKVGKEEIVGLWAAVERFVAVDHAAEWREWERRVDAVAKALAGIEGVATEAFVPEIANQVPHLAVTWDRGAHRGGSRGRSQGRRAPHRGPARHAGRTAHRDRRLDDAARRRDHRRPALRRDPEAFPLTKESSIMSAYLIARVNVTDPKAYEGYKKLAAEAIQKYGGRYLARRRSHRHSGGRRGVPTGRHRRVREPGQGEGLLRLARVPEGDRGSKRRGNGPIRRRRGGADDVGGPQP